MDGKISKITHRGPWAKKRGLRRVCPEAGPSLRPRNSPCEGLSVEPAPLEGLKKDPGPR